MTDTTPSRLKLSIFRVLNPRASQLEAELRIERERIDRLEDELAELRRDSLRIAELTDLIEDRLAPPAAQQ